MAKAPGAPPLAPAFDARRSTHWGMRTGITSSIASAKSTSRFAIRNCSQGFVLTVPKIVPVMPATTPSAAYTIARPSTYESVSQRAGRRAVSPTDWPPTMAIVTGIMG